MERLTRRSDTGHAYYPRCFEEPCNGNGCKFKDCPFDETICERLAAYEDSELEPEEVSALVKDWSDLRTIIGECGGIDRLRELAEADKDGRVVVPPCKVGDVLYRASPSGVVVHRVANMVYRELTSRWYIDTIPNLPYASEELGKTTFLTREEAEKALEAMREEETT